MPLVFKQTNGYKGDCLFLRKSEVLMIMLLCEVYGWRLWDKHPLIFNQSESELLFEALEKASVDIAATSPPECSCPDCTLQELIRVHHMELIKSLVDFCGGQAFEIQMGLEQVDRGFQLATILH